MKSGCSVFTFLCFLCALLFPEIMPCDEKPSKISFQPPPQNRAQMHSRLKEAQKTGFLFFTAEWCGVCKKMEQTTFRNKRVKKVVESRCLPYLVDIEKSPGDEWREFYKVGAFPTILLLGKDGSVVDILLGYLEPEDLIAQLDASLRGAGPLSQLKKKYGQDPGDGKNAMALARFYFDMGQFTDAEPILNKLLPIAKDPKTIVNALYQLGYIALTAKDSATAAQYFEKIAAQFPGFEEMERVYFNLAHHYLITEQSKKGLDLIEKGLASGIFRQKEAAWSFQARLAAGIGNWVLALDRISKIEAGNNFDPLGISVLKAHYLMRSGRHGEGETLLDRLHAEAQGNPDRLAELAGSCLMYDVHLARALEWVEQTFPADGSASGEWRGLHARLLWTNGRRREGEAEMLTAIEMTRDKRIRDAFKQIMAEWRQESSR